MNVCLYEQLSLNHPALLFKITSVINRIYLFQKTITCKLYTWMSWNVHCSSLIRNFPVSKMATKSIQTDGVFSCTVMFFYYTIDMHCIMIYTVYFYWWRNPEYLKETKDLLQGYDKLLSTHSRQESIHSLSGNWHCCIDKSKNHTLTF